MKVPQPSSHPLIVSIQLILDRDIITIIRDPPLSSRRKIVSGAERWYLLPLLPLFVSQSSFVNEISLRLVLHPLRIRNIRENYVKEGDKGIKSQVESREITENQKSFLN